MIKGDFDRLKELADHNMCAADSGVLDVAWDAQEDSHFIRCGVCGPTDSLTRRLSRDQEYRAGAPSAAEFIEQDMKKGGRKAMPPEKLGGRLELEGIPRADLATGEVLDQARLTALISYAQKYGLDPYRGHVMVMYGKPYIGIDGYLYLAAKSGINYSLLSRPMTTQEEEQYKVDKSGQNWLAEVNLLDTGQKFNGIGIVTYEELTAKSTKKPDQLRSPVVAAHPWQLGQKRAEWQAMRRAFPIGESET